MRVALLGCGKAAGTHAKGLMGAGKKLGERVDVYFASRQLQRAQTFSQRYGGAGAFASYEEAIASADIDVVAILVPPRYHLDLCLAALEAGKDVILEKPPFLSHADGEMAAAASARTGQRIFVAENYHYKPICRAIADHIDAVGDPLFVQINAVKQQRTGDWRDDASLAGGGALFEGGIHWINYVGNLGLTLERVGGLKPAVAADHGGNGGGQEQAQTSLERSMLVTLAYREGAVGSLIYSWEVPSTLRGLRISRIFGRRGSMTFESNGLFLLVNGSRKRLRIPGIRDLQGYGAMFADFVRTFTRGGEPSMTLARALEDLAWVEAAYQSEAGRMGRGAAQSGDEPRDRDRDSGAALSQTAERHRL